MNCSNVVAISPVSESAEALMTLFGLGLGAGAILAAAVTITAAVGMALDGESPGLADSWSDVGIYALGAISMALASLTILMVLA